MTEKEIINITNKVFEESFEIEREKLRPEAHIFTDLGLDSLDIVDLVAGLQKSFGVNIRNEEEIRNVRTLQDVYQFIFSVKKERESKKNT
jgi:acyl carrier protein